MAKTTRTLDGRKFTLFDFCFTKREAKSEAAAERKRGKRARVIKAGDGWQVWVG